MDRLDWIVVGLVMALTALGGLAATRFSSRHGVRSYFTGDRKLPWWAIAISNTATYQSGNGAFVMLLVMYGLAGNWLWWSSWVIWMPLVAIVWAPLWHRLRITTTAELMTVRYAGSPAIAARRLYAAVCCFGFAVLIMGYITGFFAKTIAPIVAMSELEILAVFGATTAVYTVFGGLVGVVVTEVLQFGLLIIGSAVFAWIAMAQHGGWVGVVERIASFRPEALEQLPPVAAASQANSIDLITIAILVAQGFLFAGSPTAGEGSTAQRFLAARSEADAVGGQLLNCLLALTVRTLPMIGIGLVALSVFVPGTLVGSLNPPPDALVLEEPVHAWAELIKRCSLPPGLTGLLIAVEVAAYMSTLSAILNWGSSFMVNDIYRPLDPFASERRQILVSRVTALILFLAAGAVAVLYVKHMVGWFMFVNSAMVMCLLPLAFFRFFWWRFNVWGELTVLAFGLPCAVLVWFGLDYQNTAVYPLWQGLAILLGGSVMVLFAVTLATPPEPIETLTAFYERCRPPGWWGPVRLQLGLPRQVPAAMQTSIHAALAIAACLGLVLMTNALFVADWGTAGSGMLVAGSCTVFLIRRVLFPSAAAKSSINATAAHPSLGGMADALPLAMPSQPES